MIGDGDLELIFESGDFDIEAVFNGSIEVRGWFTGPTDEALLFGQVQIEAAAPTFMCPTDAIAAVQPKMQAVIDGATYIVERKQKVGTGASVVYLKS